MTTRNYAFEYVLLYKLLQDCNFYIANGKYAETLWARDEQKQIDKMRELYDLIPVKPEWLTREQIDTIATKMGAK